MKNLLTILIILLFTSCNKSVKKESFKNLSAQEIIDKAIENSCQGNCELAIIDFTFRDRVYRSKREGGKYQLERIKIENEDTVHDILNNEGLKRFVNEVEIKVPDSIVTKISDGVNSVHYFVQLPYGLNAKAVNKKLLGEDLINGKEYFEIEVTFKKEGGGTDHDDVFVYWVNKQKYTIDYLAYSYATNGGGIRFREAYNPRVVEGIRFVDYNNYKTENLGIRLSDLDQLFVKNELKLLSKIETENVNVKLIN